MANITIFVVAVILICQFCAASSDWKPATMALLSEKNSTVWINNGHSNNTHHLVLCDGSIARIVQLKKVEPARFIKYGIGYAFGFGFHCQQGTSNSCDLAVLFLDITNNTYPGTYQKVWSAGASLFFSASHNAKENATLELASDGNMVLKDGNGRRVWSSNTTGQVLSHLDITTTGNTRLFNQANEVVWQTFEHPTDTLLVGQRLNITQQLISSHGLFNFKIRHNQIRAYAYGYRKVLYFDFAPDEAPKPSNIYATLVSVQFLIGKLTFLYKSNTSEEYKEYSFQTSITTSQFFRVDKDGGLRIYGWEPVHGWKVVYVFGWDECAFPLKCGKYGVCQAGQCTCPIASDGIQYFKPINPTQPNLGCEQIVVPPAQNSSTSSQLINFKGLSYSTYYCNEVTVVQGIVNEEDCKQACATNLTCKAALFEQLKDSSTAKGTCYSIADLFTIIGTPSETSRQELSIKIYTPTRVLNPHKRKNLKALAIIVLLALLAVVFGTSSFLLIKKMRRLKIPDRLLYIEGLTETPIRFSHNDLRVATNNFSKAIGEGGFGVVFEGVLKNGMMVAVKQLKKAGQGTDEFIAEMETLGNIHHINLVSLIGFCADKKGNRMLVYEHMNRGSLDKWIFNSKMDTCLSWNVKKKILFDVAKGLAYLHHECRNRIAHLDVKPQNILLDENFDAKLSDFGTSKLINRNESEVVTRVRGTLGYLAPEWQNGNITVKADTYSFGIVILEVITGRKILDYSQKPEYLLSLLQKKATENRLLDIVDQYCGELALQSDREEVVTIVQLGMWCLNINYTIRPAMSLVVKILEDISTPSRKYNLSSTTISPSNISNCLSSDVQPL